MNEQEQLDRIGKGTLEIWKNTVKYVNSQLVCAQHAPTKEDEILLLLNAIEGSVEIIRLAINGNDVPPSEAEKYANNMKHCAITIEQILLAVDEEKE